MSLVFSTRNGNVALAVHLMGEINEACSFAYRASLAGSEVGVRFYDTLVAKKLAQCAGLGYPLHIASPCTAENGRDLGLYGPDGWSYIRASDESGY